MSLFNKNKFPSEEKKSAPSEQDAEPGWLKNLEEMREKRKGPKERRDTPPPLRTSGFSSGGASATPRPAPKAPRPLTPGIIRKTSSDPELKKKVYEHYAARWQEEHNQQESVSGVQDEQVLLTQTWTLEADRLLLKPQTLLDDEVEVLEFNEAGALRTKEDKAQDSISEAKSEESGEIELGNREKEDGGDSRPIVQVTIVRPSLDADRPLAVINEKELRARLKAELKPQLQDILESSLKNMLLNNYDIMLSCIQQEIQKEMPKLIDEALEYNLKKIIKKEIK